MSSKKLLIGNLAYGDLYTKIFLNYHLKSLLDPSNIPAHKDRIEYLIMTDKATLPMIKNHPHFKLLEDTVPVHIKLVPDGYSHDHRYSLLVALFQEVIAESQKGGHYASSVVADLVYARDTLKKIFKRLDAGHDSVFMLPLRAAAETIMPWLAQIPHGPSEVDLFTRGYQSLHPLWVACHWETPQFTKLPFSLLWNSGSGLLARSFSITPIAFTPYLEMKEVRGVIDVEVPALCKSPYWCENWTDCPIIGVEPLFCYYPPFGNAKASTEAVGKWAAQTLHPWQHEALKRTLYYPDKRSVKITESKEIDCIVDDILRAYAAEKEVQKYASSHSPV